MIKRWALATLALLVWLPPVTAHATLQNLAGENTFAAVGSAAALVQLPTAAVINYLDPHSWVESLTTTGTYAGILIQEVGAGNDNQALLFVHLSAPAGCTTDGHCAPADISWYSIRSPGGITPDVMTLDPGKYLVSVFTDAAVAVTAQVKLPGLSGQEQLTANRPMIQPEVHQTVTAPLGGIGYEANTFTGHLGGSGGLLLGNLWGTPLVDTPVFWTRAFATTMCFQATSTAADPTHTCGYPLATGNTVNGIGIMGDSNFAVAPPGAWDFAYNHFVASPPFGRMGMFAMWLTFPTA